MAHLTCITGCHLAAFFIAYPVIKTLLQHERGTDMAALSCIALTPDVLSPQKEVEGEKAED